MPKSPEEMAAAMIANFPEKTGKPLEAWLKIAAKTGLEKHGEIVSFLKKEHGMGHGFAGLVATKLREQRSGGPVASTDLVTAQYSGPKEPLKPIYDAIVAAVKKFGADVEISPKKAYVSLRRKKQFGLVQPSTRTRVDLGLNLKGKKTTKRLEASGSFNSMCSHRVRLAKKGDVDAELKAWLKEAYEAAG